MPRKRKTTTRRRKRSTSAKSLKLRSRAAMPSVTPIRLHLKTRTVRQVEAVTLLTISILIMLALAGKLAAIGDVISLVLTRFVGYGAWFIPVLLITFSLIILAMPDIKPTASKVVGLSIATVAGLGLIHLSLDRSEIWSMAQEGTFGGYVGFTLNVLLRSVFGDIGTAVILGAILLIGFIVTFEISPVKFMTFFRWLTSGEEPRQRPVPVKDNVEPEIAKLAVPKKAKDNQEDDIPKGSKVSISDIVKKKISNDKPTGEIAIDDGPKAAAKPKAEVNPLIMNTDKNPTSEPSFKPAWKSLPFELLSTNSGELEVDEEKISDTKQTIRETLNEFGIIDDIQARGMADPKNADKPKIDKATGRPEGIIHISHQLGPTVTQYAFTPPEGVKLSKITALQNDFALKLKALSLRIEAPIPGKDKVGIELPNETRAAVGLREVMESDGFNSIESSLRIPIGKDVSNVCVGSDLAKMPHLLVAGATGSGKSVMINTILISMLYQNSPDDLKLLLVDPKRVELSGYNGIPHLLAPVITEPDKTVLALRWAVAEMTRRYKVLEQAGERNISDYNKHSKDGKMAYIVIVIDELADLMLISAKEVESAICRIAQMARAVGIHLIVATQRPSVDVVTGLIKANIPTRIAFTVASGIDSRTIIDSVGAEKLLGMGDMLFLDRNAGRMQRIQGAFISNKEIKRVVQEIKMQSEPAVYNDEILDPRGVGGTFVSSEGGAPGDGDPLEEDAINLILETGKASASLLQRHLQVGYARAARILDGLEAKGYIGPSEGAKPRKILIRREDIEG